MEHVIDVAALEPPEPLEQILDALADLPPGDHLRVEHSREPVPLYSMLRNMGYRWQTTCVSPKHFEILIWSSDLPPPDGVSESGP